MSKKIDKETLKKLKMRLLEDLRGGKKRIAELKEEDPFSDPDHVNDNAAIDTDVREKLGHETIEAQIQTLIRKLANVENALDKINKGKYGFCESCKENILPDRLELIPEARYCIACERRLIK